MERKRKHTIKKLRTRLIVLTFLMVAAGTAQVFAAASVNYIGPLWTDTSQGKVRVGQFTVNGKPAFCMEHSKESPSTGTTLTEKVYRNEQVRKILYYGWNGPGQWKGFSGQKQGITLTSLLLSEVYSKAQPVGTYNFVPGLVEFRKYVNGQPAPSLDLKFSKTSVKSFYDGALDAERSEDIKVTGTGAGKLRVTVPDGCLLHNYADGSDKSGEVVLTAGSRFYIRGASAYSKTKSTVIKGRGTALQPVVFVTASTSIQDLTRLDYVEDTADSTKLTVSWLGKSDLRITKLDAASGKPLSGAVFRIFELDGDGNVEGVEDATDIETLRACDKAVGSYTTATDGTVLAKDILQPGHSYLVIEQTPPNGYRISDEIQTLKVTGAKDIEEVCFRNDRQVARVCIDKKGERYSITEGRLEAHKEDLGGAVFEISAAEDICEWGSSAIKYKEGTLVETLVSDDEGKAESGELPPGRYSIRETGTPEGYLIDSEERICELYVDSDKTELNYSYTCVNYPVKSEIRVVKYDKASGEKLAGAHFTITDENGESVELCTGEDGTADLSMLPPGEYVFAEVTAPDGYTIDTEKQNFTVGTDENQDTIVLESYDERIESPDTSDDRHVLVKVIVYALLLAACAVALDVKYLGQRKH